MSCLCCAEQMCSKYRKMICLLAREIDDKGINFKLTMKAAVIQIVHHLQAITVTNRLVSFGNNVKQLHIISDSLRNRKFLLFN